MDKPNAPVFSVALAGTDEEVRAAQRLRYEVFVEELGGSGATVDHQNRLEQDRFDPFFDHLLLRDLTRNRIAGAYRVMREDQAARAGQFYSEDEYDLAPLRASGRPLLELGRSCVHPDYRGSAALFHLWTGLAAYVAQHGIELLFGVASFHGTDAGPLRNSLALLHHRYLAPEKIRPRARPEGFQRMDAMAESEIDRVAAMKGMPSLIKSYLRMGGCVGEGAFIDRVFNTTDVCLILDTASMNNSQAQFYKSGRA